MRIDLATLGVEPPEDSKPGLAAQTESTEILAGDAAGSAPVHDQASSSFDQAQAQSLAAQVLAQPELRDTNSKVQALQQSIDRGDYSVPASQIADAMVKELAS